jgi:glycosyltransferase involved in cell wall biosynthesis
MKYSIPISVIMPCFNSGRFISATIASILAQSFEDFEFIIVDDGSIDETKHKIEEHPDHRIKYIRCDENKGNYVARNIGISAAKGKYICMMDSDDIALPERLFTQFKFMETHPHTGCIGSLSEMINEHGNVIGLISHPLDYQKLKVSFLQDNHLTQSTIMIRHHLIKKHNLYYDESLKYTGDYKFIMQALMLFPVVNLNNVLLQYRKHPQQISYQKRQEQMNLADDIRIQQLKKLGITATDEQINLHLRLMKGLRMTRSDLQSSTDWLNDLITANEKYKIYNQSALYLFFKGIMHNVIKRSSEQII